MKWFCSLLLPLLLVSCAIPSAGPRTAIVGAKLVNGPSVIEYSIVLIEDGKFKAVGSQADVPLPKDATIINALGQSVEPLPGARIEVGQPANLLLKGATVREMREGQWRN
jgi:hypothetical protein